jgi:hypothetical protein
LADPLRDRHVPGTRDSLKLTVVGILKEYLEAFSHEASLSDSS